MRLVRWAEIQKELALQPHMATENLEVYLSGKCSLREERILNSTLGSPVWDTRAKKNSPHNIWLENQQGFYLPRADGSLLESLVPM